jgi:hypothetical protein
MKERDVLLSVIFGFVWTLFVFAVAYATTLESINETCIKTGHFYVMDNVFECKLKDKE